MFLDVKFETLTYAAHETDCSVRASAPEIMGRSTPPQGGSSPTPLSGAFLQLWLWMSLQVMGCLAMCGLQRRIPDSTPQHIFVVPSADPDTPKGAIRVNRSILRKLRRLERLKPEVFLEKDEPLPDFVKAFSPTQFLDYMIRTKNWSRVRVHNLRKGTWNKLRRAVVRLGLQAGLAGSSDTATCNAILTPD